ENRTCGTAPCSDRNSRPAPTRPARSPASSEVRATPCDPWIPPATNRILRRCNGCTLRLKEPTTAGLRLRRVPASARLSEAFVRLFPLLLAILLQAASPASTDLDKFMAAALQRRDVDRQTLSDYVLD